MFKKLYYKIKNYLATEQGQQIIKRVKSLLWRLGWMVAAVFVSWLVSLLATWNIPADLQILLGLILGEVSKFIRENQLTINANK